ncbi:MAG TPA: hypothetical protein DEG10_01455 [Leclercia adecarboxylata]|nr:hypothetical protein [Leclercia adecarboxylata]
MACTCVLFCSIWLVLSAVSRTTRICQPVFAFGRLMRWVSSYSELSFSVTVLVSTVLYAPPSTATSM